MLRKKNKPPPAVQDTILSDQLSFLDVIVETCQHSGRYTLIAESGDQTYTVMIDRGGPFNVDGGDSTGSAALVKAASLRHGTYSVIQGWPVDQPVYQLGLAAVLQGLVLGTTPEAVQLPPARGADAIRNAAWQMAATATPASDGKEPDPFARTATNGAEPAPFQKSARNGGGLHPFVQPTGPWLVAEAPAPIETPTTFEAAALHQPPPAAITPPVEAAAPIGPLVEEPEPTSAPATDLAVAEAAEAPVEAIEAPVETIEAPPAAIPESAEIAVTTNVEDTAAVDDTAEPKDSTTFLREVARAAKVDPEDEAPAAPKHQGWIERRVLQFLLWTVEVEDEPDHYTLGQVLTLVGRSLGSAFAIMVSPITRLFINRLHQTREDWRRSGEVASRRKARETKPTTKPGKLRR